MVDRFELYLSATNAGIWDWNILTGEEWWSSSFYHLLGYEDQEIPATYDTFLNILLHPDEKNIIEEAVRLHLEERSSYKIDVRLLNKDGSYKWYETVGQAKWDEAGKPIRMVGSIIDINERKTLQERFDAERALLDETQRMAHIGSWSYDFINDKVYWSNEVYSIHQVPLDREIKLEEGINFYREDFRNMISSVVENAIKSKKPWDVDAIIVTEKGKEKWVRSIGIPVFEGDEVVFLRGLFQNIDQRKRQQEKFKAVNRKLELAIAASEVGVWDWGIKDNSLKWNKHMYHLFDTKEFAFEGAYHNFADKVHPKDLPLVEEALNEAVGGGKKYEIDYRVVWKDKTQKSISAKAVLIKDAEGKPDRMIGTCIDITDRKKLEKLQQEREKSLNKINKELEAKVQERTADLLLANKELEAFSYSVSHDLRAPLRAISGFIKILEEDYGKSQNEEFGRIINIVRGNSEKMNLLIDSILEFSRLGRTGIEKTPVNMKNVFQDEFNSLVHFQKERDIRFEVSELPLVEVDLSMIKQVACNLLSNAIKYSKNREVTHINVGCEEKEDRYQFSITDNGEGFDMKYYDKLFGVFKRLHTEQDFEGTGVGLAIIKRIVERHGGEVFAESELDVGTSFYFSLPKGE